MNTASVPAAPPAKRLCRREAACVPPLVALSLGILLSAESGRAGEPGRWAFVPPRDGFSQESLLDLRCLNEKVAGESGFVRRSKDGNDFVLGNGKPVRFWALNTSAYNKHPKFPAPDLDRHARFMAKRGVNMVRFHGNVPPKGGNLSEIDRQERDKLWRLVAAMKKQGIYTTFSPYYAGPAGGRLKPSWGVLDAGKAKLHGLLFFDKRLQEAYRAWVKQVLTETNPYTGIPLAKDPALAIIQIQNEDSLLFYTSQSIGGAAKKELRRQFGDFLKKKYGSLAKALAAWGGATVPGDQDGPDDFARGEASLFLVWEMTQRRGGETRQRRVSDQLQFFTETMRGFNRMVGDFLKKLGCRQLVNAGNWRTADNVTMLDSERYSYGANEVMGVNRYYTGIHQGKYRGWAIVNGDKFTDESVLLRPRHLPVNLKQVDGYPILIPESSWVPPLGYQSEGPFLVAAYSSLTGVDVFYWFATREEGWRKPSSSNGYLPSLGKWVCNTPMLMGQWPAAVLMFRNGYLRRGETAVYEQRALEDMWKRHTPIIAEDAGYDPNRDVGDIAPESNVKGGVNPLAFLVGPVVTKYDADPSGSKVIDLAKYIDDGRKTVKSVTGELALDYGKGICLLNAPKAQGVTGFLKKAGPVFKTRDVEIRSGNDYATVLVVSMDDAELSRSRHVLVQVGTTCRSTGWRTRPVTIGSGAASRQGEEIVNFGRAPWQIVRNDVTVGIRNSNLTTARVLDANGMPRRDIALKDSGGMRTFAFPPDAMYVILQPDKLAKKTPTKAIPELPKPPRAALRSSSPRSTRRTEARRSRRPVPAKPPRKSVKPEPEPAGDDPEIRELFKKGETLFIDGRLDEAKAAFRKIVDEHPDSDSAGDARTYLELME